MMSRVSRHRQPGATLVLVMLTLLIFLGMTMSMFFESRSVSIQTSGIKLSRMHNMAALSAIQREKVEIGSYWQDDTRFSDLLGQAWPESADGYGKLFASGSVTMNAGAMDLVYNVYVKNNADDLAVIMSGMQGYGKTYDQWVDTDGWIIMTAEIFNSYDTSSPVAVQSAIIAPTGEETVEHAELSVTEQNMDRQGTGSIDSFDSQLDLGKFQ
ncbi:hypothetical protein SCOR_26325 [Sulfidibacter corallicola]|uniref:Uncharacterized protein n=1 Tax=Sulfidibacter corallicola TaxID=2818388 RepID=A0A8A4TRR8_SULCO|nr:hypothetical protein [Sulfidibacter corallicola]QTD52087.1 hypothetical protein J3U87_06400 [Sulfidibacter corallicola]